MSSRKYVSDSSSDVEVIEDSEPERQERLAQLRLTKKQSQKEVATEVFSQSQTWISRVDALTQKSVPSTSGRTTSTASIGAPPRNEAQSPIRRAEVSSARAGKPAPPPWLASTTNSALGDLSPNRPYSKTVSLKSSSQPSPAKQIDLNSFAYQKRTIERSASYSNSSRPKSGSKNKDQVVSLVASSSDVSKASKHAPAKKRGRRAEPESPVLQPVEDTRKIILERGAALLGVAPVLDAESQQDVIPGISTESQLSKEKQEEEEEARYTIYPNVCSKQDWRAPKVIW
ncbi:tetrahydrofolylpolyglutamate synthase [Rhizoctonia solani]|uniref:Tetrahydrofolylpolyglutamate synthase n=1 Tax=Rhizoctonia solani TaxID=456999 RepID=A0A8H8SSV4_9AGAM|nr:tetrahydrofolylpolyglutamate synthase [Rhizoctonia solani]QRW16409.1 tetrahydrofolylpolyglutamate synthase [Rhizoctonia solani]